MSLTKKVQLAILKAVLSSIPNPTHKDLQLAINEYKGK